MTEGPGKPDPLEQALRQWGAREALRQAQSSSLAGEPARIRRAIRGAGPHWLLRWGPLAAGIVLTAVGIYLVIDSLGRPDGGIFMSPSSTAKLDTHPAPELPPLASRPGADALAAELAQAKAALANDQEQIQALQQRALVAQQAAAEQLRLLQAQVTDAQKKNGELAEQLRAAPTKEDVARLKDSLAQFEQQRDQLASAQDKLKKQNDDLNRRLASAASELAGAGQSRQDEEARRRKVEAELAQVKSQQEQWFTTVQRAYLNVAERSAPVSSGAAAAPSGVAPTPRPDGTDVALLAGPPSLAARQAAARASGLLQRAARVRPMTRSAQTRAAIDALEVALTRLDLLDAQAGESQAAFADVLSAGGVMAKVHAVLAATEEGPLVRSVFVEARLVLEGAERG